MQMQMKRCKCRHIGGANYLHLHFSTSTRSDPKEEVVGGLRWLFALIAHMQSHRFGLRLCLLESGKVGLGTNLAEPTIDSKSLGFPYSLILDHAHSRTNAIAYREENINQNFTS